MEGERKKKQKGKKTKIVSQNEGETSGNVSRGVMNTTNTKRLQGLGRKLKKKFHK